MKVYTLYQHFQKCATVTTDSRHCPINSLFFALKGASFDGNKFAAKALEDGCAYAVVDDPAYVVADDPRYLLVDDCLTSLQDLAHYHRKELAIPVIAITGTNGKTTTKELVATVLSSSFEILATEGNLNNHIGVPLTLLKLTNEHQIAIIEMGANHPGEIAALARIADPDYGIVTNVGKAHLEGFGSFEGVIKTKNELFDYLRKKEGSIAFVNHDDSLVYEMAHNLECIYYGKGPKLFVNGHSSTTSSYLTLVWSSDKYDEYNRVFTNLIGDYNLPNVLAALAVGLYFGVDSIEASKAIANYVPKNNRSQLLKTEANTLIVDAYNANPSSMAAALDNFNKMQADAKILILGEMRELGEQSHAEHQRVVNTIGECSFDEVLLVGKEFAAVDHAYRVFEDVQQLIAHLYEGKPSGKTILIKGSNGVKLTEVIGHL